MARLLSLGFAVLLLSACVQTTVVEPARPVTVPRPKAVPRDLLQWASQGPGKEHGETMTFAIKAATGQTAEEARLQLDALAREHGMFPIGPVRPERWDFGMAAGWARDYSDVTLDGLDGEGI